MRPQGCDMPRNGLELTRFLNIVLYTLLRLLAHLLQYGDLQQSDL